jgi:hypothetical protein
MEYSKVKIKELKTESENRNIEGLYKNEFKNRSEPIANLVKDATCNLNSDSHIVLNRWKNHISLLLNVHGVNFIFDIWYILLTAVALTPGGSSTLHKQKTEQHNETEYTEPNIYKNKNTWT